MWRTASGGGQQKTSLTRYADQLGHLVERKMALGALLAAKQEAEHQAVQARQAMLEARAYSEALRAESQQRMETQSRLAYLASHDALTGLPNRSLFNEQLAREMEQARRNGRLMALLYLDLDRFKDVNDTLGHAVGDALLKEAGARLEQCLRSSETVARMGGDEFAILQGGLTDPAGARVLAERVIAALGRPFTIAERSLFVGVSIGITLFPIDGEEPDFLLRNADLAMYQSKQEGRNCCRFFDSVLNAQVQRRAALEQALREALARGQFALAYQPQVDLQSGRITGVEAVLRWRHPDFGAVGPDEFIPLAERSGLIDSIGAWVLREGCLEMMRWTRAGLPPLNLAVNVSTIQLKDAGIMQLLTGILAETGLPPERLELEITETGVMSDMRGASEILATISALGVSLAIDDFGTGYSSLSYLRRLPVDRLKIDRSFICDVTNNQDAAAIARTIVTLGRTLRLAVVAEGVETEDHARFVRAIGCNTAQGYHFGRPTTPEALRALFEVPQPELHALTLR